MLIKLWLEEPGGLGWVCEPEWNFAKENKRDWMPAVLSRSACDSRHLVPGFSCPWVRANHYLLTNSCKLMRWGHRRTIKMCVHTHVCHTTWSVSTAHARKPLCRRAIPLAPPLLSSTLSLENKCLTKLPRLALN